MGSKSHGNPRKISLQEHEDCHFWIGLVRTWKDFAENGRIFEGRTTYGNIESETIPSSPQISNNHFVDPGNGPQIVGNNVIPAQNLIAQAVLDTYDFPINTTLAEVDFILRQIWQSLPPHSIRPQTQRNPLYNNNAVLDIIVRNYPFLN
jgi:hypothetical protein